ncbi:oligomeric Golgi complex subunit 3 [Diplogelasinospora grovesii]|uniref:Conserved oligomeric Golgi complex subunit 3 n=1 Tax=Diplogelasinospora grovesii TaxID=303347 RepID=A0AAN6NBR7_9PEZI|nr:oligomeric Golgi complex subunit 3 [Diplogelasinospora grovesii]
MYEDSWYSFVPEFQQQKRGTTSQSTGHRRRESLLQQPNGTTDRPNSIEPLSEILEQHEPDNSPPEATLARRAKSYSDLYDIVKALSKPDSKKKRRKRRKDSNWDALTVIEPKGREALPEEEELANDDVFRDELLQASQQEYLLYHDRLAMTERHLETLVEDTNSALELLESLCKSFRSVEDQTTSFRAQCDDLLSEQKRLQTLAEEVGTELEYYSYLENVTRRLNAPGASRLVDNSVFGEVLDNLDSCIAFMEKNPSYRDAETYLARYQALLTKALHLLEVGFTNRVEKVSSEISKQILATQSESARHALAYGRFEETLMESYSLIPNIQTVVLRAYDRAGQAKSGDPSFDTFSNTAKNLFQAYWTIRDRDLKPITQHDLDTFKAEVKELSVETAVRNYTKQCFERSYNEASLFGRIFALEPQFSSDSSSAFAALKPHKLSLVNGTNIAPVAANLQSVLGSSNLQTICNVVGWVTNEYLLLDYDEEETGFARHCRELTARLLTEHLWTFTDAVFEAEIAKSITKAVDPPDALKIGPLTNGVASSNAYPPVKRALELLVMFDQSMPKERCQRNSPVVYKIVKECIASLKRGEARIKSGKIGTDPDLFMIKNLLILKNELVSLEIGDVRDSVAGASGMQHFGQIWEALSPGNLIGLLTSFTGLSSVTSYIPGSSLWSRVSGSSTPTPEQMTKGNTNGVHGHQESQDASEQLDQMLRQSIVAFTQRWAGLFNDARARKLGAKNVTKVQKELDEMLDVAFSNQPEVVAKLKEAIQMNAQAQQSQEGNKITRV